MAWKCPQCGQTNDNELKKCACGYAYYEVLGLKEDAPAESVKQTYEYLIKVWKAPTDAQNAGSRGRSDERVKKISDAYAVFKEISAAVDSGARSSNIIKIAVGIGVVLVIIAAGIFFFSNKMSEHPTAVPAPSPLQTAVPQNSGSAPAAQSAESPHPVMQTAPERKKETPDMSADKTPDWAVESVKKSHVLDRFSTVEVLMDKWTKETSDRLKSIGWIAKKVDEKAYLVTYTATDGVTPTGFYFEINVETGEIRNIAASTELQQKYGVKGN